MQDLPHALISGMAVVYDGLLSELLMIPKRAAAEVIYNILYMYIHVYIPAGYVYGKDEGQIVMACPRIWYSLVALLCYEYSLVWVHRVTQTVVGQVELRASHIYKYSIKSTCFNFAVSMDQFYTPECPLKSVILVSLGQFGALDLRSSKNTSMT